MEIANEMIPNIMKTVSGELTTGTGDPLMVVSSFASDVPLISDPECYAYLLQFYDGLCSWEEGSSTPVLHITWATHALYSLNRFDLHARTNLLLKSDSSEQLCKEDSTPGSARSVKLKRLAEDTVIKHRGVHWKRMSKTNNSDKILSLSYDANCCSMAGLPSTLEDADVLGESEKLCVTLYSEKMMGMKDLLVSERLNSGAIKLQLTAQSQVRFKQNKTIVTGAEIACISDVDGARKRLRRE